MKWRLLTFCFILQTQLFAHYIYVESDEPFVLLNQAQTQEVTAVWINLTDLAKPIAVKLSNGKRLNRYFKANMANAHYVIENQAIRYRPNLTPAQADTITQPVLEISAQQNTAKMATTVAQIAQLKYEFERVELIKAELIKPNLTCEELSALINCAKYDASKVDLINLVANSTPKYCLEKLKTLVATNYHSSIKP